MIAVIDLETSGFSITKNAVVEIGVIIADENLNEIDSFRQLIKPYTRPDSDELVSYKDDAMAIHGIKMEQIMSEGLELEDAIESFVEFMKKYYCKFIIGHKIKTFDEPRLNYLLNKNDYTINLSWFAPIKDTLEIARQKGFKNCSLPDLCKHFGIQHNEAHTALGDCRATLELYKILTR